MNYNVYIDESGNTGNIELRENLEWDYDVQTHFALGAIYVNENVSQKIEEEIKQILYKFDPKLGIENELKSKAKYRFRNELLKEITDIMINNQVDFYFDIANKKYKVMMNLVEYCVYPYYINNNIFSRDKKVNAANYLYKTLPNEIIKQYIDLCQKEHNDDSVKELIDFLLKLEKHYLCNKQKSNPINSVLDFVKEYKLKKLTVSNLFPIKDFNNKGSEESFLPNVDAYNNIIASICKLRLKRDDRLNIIHDEQKQFSLVIKKWTDYLIENNLNINQIKFVDSKENILLQIVDYYTGNIIRLYRKIVQYEVLNRDDRELIKILSPLLRKCNIVAPNNETEEFFNKCNIRQTRTPIPF